MSHPQPQVADYMSTAVVTASPDDMVEDVDFEMKMAGIRHVPVVDQHNRLLGIASERDLLRAVARAGGRPVPLRAVMTTRVRTVPADAPALQAVDLMLQHKVGCAPVVDPDDRLLGLVTETDFLRLLHQLLRDTTLPHSSRKAS